MVTNFLRKKNSSSRRSYNSYAFSLFEVLIVVAIIALLLILSFVVYSSQIQKARDAKSKSNIERIQIALEEFEKDNNCYPAGIPACGINDPEGSFGNYLSKIPCTPNTDNEGYFYYADPDGEVCRSWYWMFTVLEYEDDPEIENIGCQNGCGPTDDEEALTFNYYESSPNAPIPFTGTEPPPPPEDFGGHPGFPPPPLPGSGYYGCFSGVCQGIEWDPDRPGPICDPNYSKLPHVDCEDAGGAETCMNESGQPQNECLPWW